MIKGERSSSPLIKTAKANKTEIGAIAPRPTEPYYILKIADSNIFTKN
jgi:hypothetical protein